MKHRVREIDKIACNARWSCCPKDENPADIGARGKSSEQLKDYEL